MNLKIKTISGHITDLQVEEIMEVDGKPYRSAEDNEIVAAQLARLDGRISVIERAIFPPVDNEGNSNG